MLTVIHHLHQQRNNLSVATVHNAAIATVLCSLRLFALHANDRVAMFPSTAWYSLDAPVTSPLSPLTPPPPNPRSRYLMARCLHVPCFRAQGWFLQGNNYFYISIPVLHKFILSKSIFPFITRLFSPKVFPLSGKIMPLLHYFLFPTRLFLWDYSPPPRIIAPSHKSSPLLHKITLFLSIILINRQ